MREGDIVKASARGRRIVRFKDYGRNYTQAILLRKSGDVCHILFTTGDSIQTTEVCLEVVHDVDTVGAATIHASISTLHRYRLSLEEYREGVSSQERDRLQTIAARNIRQQQMEQTAFAVGDMVRVQSTNPRWNNVIGTVARAPNSFSLGYQITSDNPPDGAGSGPWFISASSLRPYNSTTATPVPSTTTTEHMPAPHFSEWKVGSVLRRIDDRKGVGAVPVGSLCSINRAPFMSGGAWCIQASAIPAKGYGWDTLLVSSCEWVSASLEIPSAEWKRGDILRRHKALSNWEFLGECAIGDEVEFISKDERDGRIIIQGIRYKQATSVFHAEDFTFVRRPDGKEVKEKPKKALALPIYLPITTAEEKELLPFFEEQLEKAGLVFNAAGMGKKGKMREVEKNGLVVGFENQYYLYYTDGLVTNKGSLLENWNEILELVEALGKKVAYKVHAAPKPKETFLKNLPNIFILEEEAEKPINPEKIASFKENYGFTGEMGKYTLFYYNTMSATQHATVAQAFQDKHTCLRLKSGVDISLLNSLLQNRKTAVSSPSSKQRFAIEVESSRPLLPAFIAFMASIGYRQENPSVNDGEYILINGGNVVKDVKASWQYSAVKNNRNATISLTEPKTTTSESGWEKMCSRLSNSGVVAPVLDDEEEQRIPQTGDTVIVLSTEEGNNEELVALRAHTVGKTYTVKLVSGGNILIKETGKFLHPSRVEVVEKPKNIENGDLVIMTNNLGESLKTGDILTFMNNSFIDLKGDTYFFAAGNYALLTDDLLTENLLKRSGIVMPLVVLITNPEAVHYNQEVVLNDAWAINKQELGFWVEAGSDREAYYVRSDFRIVSHHKLEEVEVRIVKGNTPSESTIQIGGADIPVAKLEQFLAEAYSL